MKQEINRTNKKKITLRVSDKEHQDITKLAVQLKTNSLAEVLRICYEKHENKYIPTEEKEERKNIVKHLNRIGNNINQITRSAHLGNFTDDWYDNLQTALNELSSIKRSVLKL